MTRRKLLAALFGVPVIAKLPTSLPAQWVPYPPPSPTPNVLRLEQMIASRPINIGDLITMSDGTLVGVSMVKCEPGCVLPIRFAWTGDSARIVHGEFAE